LTGVIQTSSHTLAQDFPLELREHGEQTRHRATCGGGQIECFRQRNETHTEMLKFL
jgi:hypothetical protein